LITKFKLFAEAINTNDMKNAIDLNIEMGEKKPTNPNQPQQDIQKNAKTNITNTQEYINSLNIQKQKITDEINQMENAQRDLMPNNPNDPNNAKNQKTFIEGQQAKIKNNRAILTALEDKIKLLQTQISNNKEKYL